MAEATALREVITTSDFEQHNATEQKGAELAVSVDTSEMVQYMVEKGLKEVPPEYVLPHKHRPSATKTKNLPGNLRIPVIDMGDFHHKDGAERVIGEIGRACEEWGFFQVINHGLPAALMQEAMEMCREFFALPMEEKELYSMKTSSGIGYGRRFAVKEGARVDWVDRLGFWSASEVHRMRQPLHIKRPVAFNETMAQYGDEILKLAHLILTALSRHADLPSEYLLERLGEAKAAGVRTGMNYYPPCPQPDLVMGIGSHADGSVLTIVQQDGTPGLEVLKDGLWVPIPAMSDAFVINIGDQIQMISNDRYKSVVHRVTAGAGRKSISNFFLPGWETTISPAPRFCNSSDPPRYRPVKFSEYITEFMKVPLGEGRFVDNFRVPRSLSGDSMED
ncbi:hypothetical protein M758_1G206000 [Ceratodon purpureus]|nr:hypothetical protein M758_1G206000 [Ceratodon purpureus]